MSNRRHMVRGHHRSGGHVRRHFSYEMQNPMYEEYNPLGAAAKIGLAVVGLAALGGIVYYATRPAAAAPLSTMNPAPTGGYTPSNGTHALTVPVGTTMVVNPPSDTPNGAATLTAGDTTIATTGANSTITGVKAGTTTISMQWTNPSGAVENDSVVVTVQ